jgi:hypothetical protein
MSSIPPDNHVNNQSITVATSNNQPTQQARREERSSARRGRGAGTRRQSTAPPPNFPPNADNVSVNSSRHSGRSSAQSNRPQPSDTVTISRQKFDQLRARLLILEIQAPSRAIIIFQTIEANENGSNAGSSN